MSQADKTANEAEYLVSKKFISYCSFNNSETVGFKIS